MTESEAGERAELARMVQRLMDGDYASDAEAYVILERAAQALACTSGHLSNLIFWSKDPELTAERVIDRALAYRPIAL